MKAVVITYCKPCKYEARAIRAAQAIKDEFGIAATLEPGKGGIFEVAVDGQVVSKKTRGHFPEEKDIVSAIASSKNKHTA